MLMRHYYYYYFKKMLTFVMNKVFFYERGNKDNYGAQELPLL